MPSRFIRDVVGGRISSLWPDDVPFYVRVEMHADTRTHTNHILSVWPFIR